ncbi:MAG: thiamine pyrophosphate-dependent dehydrogenase E1 component subunit alpha [Chloroflexi bacterium]|nr:thiamine pyrophosphate-dependent dehydrogenase E1 component subunit alpha [Chloroflexota bacterium]
MTTFPDPVAVYRTMLLARLVDERIWQLNRLGRAHFAVPCAGHEGVAGFAFALDPARDYLVPHYRDLAALLVFGTTPRDVFCHLFAKANDPMSGGRQMFAHWGDARRRILSISSPQPNHVTHAVGIALASKIRREDAVTWTGFGDGSSSKGDVHEAMNFAAIHKLPVVFCCENNSYAISTPQEKQMAIRNVADRAAGYGMPGCTVDGGDPLAVFEQARVAVERARHGGGPALIEIKVYRFLPHTSNDDDRRYRSREEVERARVQDPVTLFRQRLVDETIWDDGREQALRQELQHQIDEALEFAEHSPAPRAEDAFANVYAA